MTIVIHEATLIVDVAGIHQYQDAIEKLTACGITEVGALLDLPESRIIQLDGVNSRSAKRIRSLINKLIEGFIILTPEELQRHRSATDKLELRMTQLEQGLAIIMKDLINQINTKGDPNSSQKLDTDTLAHATRWIAQVTA